MSSPQSVSSDRLDDLLEPFRQIWDSYSSGKSSHLLRLVLLRDLMRRLHSERSRALAQGGPSSVKNLKPIEEKIEKLKYSTSLKGTLDSLLEGPSPHLRKGSLLPSELFTRIPRDRLERLDREWERVIAAEAFRIGWKFWAMDAWVDPHSAQEFHSALNTRLAPEGALLFAEASPHTPSPSTEHPPGWKGRWLIITKPKVIDPSIHFDWNGLPSLLRSPESPRWSLLFPV